MTDFASQTETYLRDALIAVTALDGIAMWLLGDIPETQINEGYYPMCKILIVPEEDTGESSVTFWEQQYTGRIMFIESQTTAPSGYRDFGALTEAVNDTLRPPSYARVRGYAEAARDELRKSAHAALGGLVVNGEITCNFTVGRIECGSGFDAARANTWLNLSSLEFAVITHKRRE